MRASSEGPAWSSRAVFLLAAIGASVGLGNIWKFPYLTGVNGGGAFVLIYVAVVAFIAIPILIGELMLGRRGRASPPQAMANVAELSGRSRRWGWVAGMGLVGGFLITTYYSVIAGWAMAHVWPAFAGEFAGIDKVGATTKFNALLASPWRLAAWHGAFTILTAAIVAQGLKAGIERWISILMPALFAFLIGLVIYASVAGDLQAGLAFLFTPDFSKITGAVMLAAVGQAFFSIGVAMGIMMIYGAYLPKKESLTQSAVYISLADTAVALLAGIAIFPLVFASGLNPAEGPGLVFVILPIAFGKMTGGAIVGGVFFVLLTFAALTSSIALLEGVVAWLEQNRGWSRPKATWLASFLAWFIGLATVFSFNVWADVYLLGQFEAFAKKTPFDLIDYLTSNLMMPVGGVLMCLFIGWSMRPDIASEELGFGDGAVFKVWRLVLIRWLVPASILAVLVANL